MDGYTDHIATLYQTAYSFIEQSLDMDAQTSLFHYCPFFCYQMFACASFIVLRITRTKYFESLLDIDAAKELLNAAISALRRISIANNDLPARLSDVIGFFCALPNHGVTRGQMIDSLQLQVRNRLSMSIVYDSLWEWRKHFQAGQGPNGDSRTDPTNKYPPSQTLRALADYHLHSEVTPDGFDGTLGLNCLGGLPDTFSLEWLDDFLNAH